MLIRASGHEQKHHGITEDPRIFYIERGLGVWVVLFFAGWLAGHNPSGCPQSARARTLTDTFRLNGIEHPRAKRKSMHTTKSPNTLSTVLVNEKKMIFPSQNQPVASCLFFVFHSVSCCSTSGPATSSPSAPITFMISQVPSL